MLALALLLAVHPAPDTLRYSFESVNRQDIDATAAGQGMMQNEMKLSGRMHVVLSDTTGGVLAHVVIDTATFTSSNPQMAMLPLEVPSGTAFHLFVVDGEIRDGLTPPEMSIGAAQAMGIVGNLFPKVRRDLAIGGTWTDTTTTDSLTATGRMTNQTVTRWEVSDRQGEQLTFTGTLTGTVSAEMEQATISGATTGTQRVVIVPGKPVQHSESTVDADIQMLMGEMALAMKQHQLITITLEP